MNKNKSQKILLVEDEGFLSFLYKTKLSQEGYEVEIAEDGQAGYEKATDNPFDLILLDVVMPKVHGFDLLQKLKRNKKTKKTPVIMFSNLSQKEEIEKGLKLGAKDFIIKTSLTPSELSQKVNKFLK